VRAKLLWEISVSAREFPHEFPERAPREDVPSERAGLIASRYVVLFSLA